ncbi:tetratricopeptide repeat protein [Actinosynnema sp. NPDC059797]
MDEERGLRILLVAHVAAEARCLAESVPSARAVGETWLLDASDGDEVSTEAARLGVPTKRVTWRDSLGELFDEAVRWGSDGAGAVLVVYADEVFEEVDGDALGAVPAAGAFGAVSIRHRLDDAGFYDEEHETRMIASGAPGGFTGRFPVAYQVGEQALDPDALPVVAVLSHQPARWPGLSAQRIARTESALLRSASEQPHSPEVAYALLHCSVSLREWEVVRERVDRYRALGDVDVERGALVAFHDATALLCLNKPSDSLRQAKNAVRAAPRFGDAWFLIGEINRLGGRAEQAVVAYRKAFELGRDASPVAVEDFRLTTWRPAVELAALAERAGDESAARLWADRARELQPTVESST